jgi:hypothetical protein
MADDGNHVRSLKRIRGVDPDLKIILHYDDENGTEQTKEYFHYSQILCSVCGFIDAALSADMEEKETRVINMHGFPPALFDVALGHVLDPLQNPIKIKKIPLDMVKQLLPFYNMYDFESGRMICDDAIAREFILTYDVDFVDHWKDWLGNKSEKTSLKLLLQTTVVADEIQLPMASKITARYVNLHMSNFPGRYHLEHIKILHPMMKKGHFLDSGMSATFDQDEIESSLFPKLVLTFLSVKCKSCWSCRMRSSLSLVLVEGAGIDRVNGLYKPFDYLNFDKRGFSRTLDNGVELTLECSNNGWWTLHETLQGGFERYFYKAQLPAVHCDGCRAYPPLQSDKWHVVQGVGVLPIPKFSFQEGDTTLTAYD